MEAKEVLRVLQITRPTLTKYVKESKISEKLDSEEIFEEIISLLHCYSMKMYSSRKAKKIKEILEDSDSAES